MTIDEAIEILEDELRENAHREGSWLEASHKLGIEALKAIQGLRILDFARFGGLLPGETKE